MAKHSQGLHHHLVRKRIHAKHEPYPHPDRWKRYVDEAIYPIGVLAPLLTVPQLLEVWISKEAAGLSLLTWSSWTFFSAFWIIYGIMHKEKPIIISNIAWLLIELGVVAGIILYN